MEWQAVAKSVIGVKHIKTEKPCQDYSAYSLEKNGRVIVGAVSDGMGSAEYSDIGSRLAVESAISILKEKKVWALKADEHELKRIFEDLLQSVRNILAREAHNNSYSIDKLACTLIAFVATPKWLVAMQVGDGQIVACSSARDYQLLFMPDKGEYANETTPITSTRALQEMKFLVSRNCYEFICAATDGIENISLLKNEGWKPFDRFFDGLVESISSNQKSLEEKEEEIENFLNSQDLNQRTDDDKTLLLCAYGNFNPTQSSPNLVSSRITSSTSNFEPPEYINQFFHEIRNQLVQIPEAEGAFPTLAIRKNNLEVTLTTSKPLTYPQPLVDRIRELFIEENSIQVPVKIRLKKVIIYNQHRDTSTLYFRDEFYLEKQSIDFKNIFLPLILALGISASIGFLVLAIDRNLYRKNG